MANIGKATAITALLCTVGLAPAKVSAQDWPPKQMRIVIAHEVGSSQNQSTRALGEAWEKILGTKFIYENKSGASGRVGYDYFIGLDKDCSSVLSTNLASASIMYIQQKPAWDWRKVLAPVGVFGVDPGAIFVRRDSRFKTLKDVIEAAKTKPLTLSISFWQSPENLQIHQVMDTTGAKFEIIPIPSSTELVTQVMGGHIDIGYSKVAIVERAGDQVRTIAIPMATNPVPAITDNAPTVDEVVGAKTIGVASYRAIVASKQCSDNYPARFRKIQETFAETIKTESFLKAMESQGVQRDLVMNLSTDEIYDQIINRYWRAFDEFGSIYDKKQ
jgi:tripartite-type tricarboxylate transporter receptor subunit TctC